MTRPDFCTDLPFEAEFLGGPVWRLDDPLRAGEATEAARQDKVRLVSCRVPVDDMQEPLSLAGFRRVECLVTLERSIAAGDFPQGVRLARGADADACADVAARALRQDRFHADPMIDDAAADRLKAAWVRNSVTGRADAVFVVEKEGRIVAFNACLRRGSAAVIDLIAVAPEAQGQGVGRRLVQAMEAHFGTEGASLLRLGTQAANSGSLAFYAALGFVETTRQDSWHWVP